MEKKSLYRVGLAQIPVEMGNRAENQQRVSDWMKTYYQPSELPTAVVLPELWDVGYALDSVPRLADPEGHQSRDFLGKLARKYGTWFIGGSVMVSDHGRFFNRAQVIDPSGELVAHYDKVHLVPFITKEDDVFSHGESPCIFDFAGVKAGSIVCYDIRFPEWIRIYALKGVEILFVSGEWTLSRMDLWRTMLRAHSIENLMVIAATNTCGVSGGIHFGGGSLVCNPAGEVLYEAGEKIDGGFITLDLSGLAANRAFLKVFEMRLPHLYRSLCE